MMMHKACVETVQNQGSNMPMMLRPKGKAKKVAYAILGVPDNIANRKTKKERDRDIKLAAITGLNYR